MAKENKGSPAMILITVCIAQFMAPFMLTSVGVALPSLGRELGASAMQLGLVEQLYVLSLAMTMLTFGRFGDIIGQRKLFLAGLCVFTLLTSLLGYSNSIHTVMVFRFVQGIGGSMVLSGSMALVAAAYPPEQRARKIGLVSACTYAGLSTGPVIGGYVTLHFGWRHVFLITVPIGLAAIGVCLFGMKEMEKNARGEHMDWKGSLAYAVSVGLVMTGAAHAKDVLLGIPLIVAGLAGLVLFIWMEAGSSSPLLDVRLFSKNRFFTLSCLAAMGNYAATFGLIFLMSLFLQYAKGLSPRQAGYVLLMQPLMQVAASLVVGRLTERFDITKVATSGMLASSTGLLVAAFTMGTAAPVWMIIAELMLIGAGFGIFITPNSTAIMGSVERRQYGVASGMIGAMRTLGMAVSLTTISLIFSLCMGKNEINAQTLPAFLLSMRTGLVVYAMFSCLGVILSMGRGRKATL
ncbi:Major facilitator superfamily MFS_1 [Desulfosarcina cetonica]|nr:Major facilitator superfamily MFS_1 [Desulfosarcina cetonica]